MAFLEEDDTSVLEKNNGTVKRIIHGQLQPESLLDLDVANQGERGMLGIAITRNNNGSINVFLYFTESGTGVITVVILQLVKHLVIASIGMIG